MRYIVQWPAFGITAEIAEKLNTISPASIDRYLKKDKEALKLKGKSRIPVHAFYTSQERKQPGFWQTDTVRHCGQAASGRCLHTLTAADIASGWTELRSLPNNAHKRAFEALADIKTAVPLPVLEFHSDNGSEFISHATEDWRKREGIPFTGSCGRRKNGNCFAGQKNGTAVREYAGCGRLEGMEERALPATVYQPLAPLLNFFMPTQKLKSKTRAGSKEIIIYDGFRSPFRRLTESAELPQQRKDSLLVRIALYNPVELQDNVNKAILRLGRRLAQLSRVTTREQI